MTIVIFYEKPGCANNARQKRLLRAAGHAVEARNLLAEPWTAERLRAFFGARPTSEWFNRAAPRVKSGEIDPDRIAAADALALMLAEPLLIRRPLMEAGGKLMAGFDLDQIRACLGLPDGEFIDDNPETCRREPDARCSGPKPKQRDLEAP